MHRGTRYTQVGGTEEAHAGATGPQHLTSLGGRERGQIGCGGGVRKPEGHLGVQCIRLGAYRGGHGGAIHSQMRGGLGKRERGHVANSEEARRLEGHPGAQCTQRREAGRAPERSGVHRG